MRIGEWNALHVRSFGSRLQHDVVRRGIYKRYDSNRKGGA